MKRTLIYALTITAIALIGCSKEDVKKSATGMTLIANVNEPETSKATISDSWKFSFEEGDVVMVTNSTLSESGTYYTFTKGATNFTSEDAQTTSEDADWYAFFPGTSIDLTDQGGTMDNAADCFGYAGKQTSVEAHSKTLSITMSPKMSIIKVVNNKGSISLNAKNSDGNYITGMTASIDGESGDGPTFTVTTSPTASNLLSKTDKDTYYIAVPSQTAFDIYDGTTELKKIAADKLVAGNYYTLTIGSSTTDLSKDGNANCYIVSEAGTYKFKAVKGNSTQDADKITPASVDVLWESFGTSATIKAGDLIKNDVSYADNYITFSTNDIYKEGNAVIAAKDDSGNILWSWHIWLTDAPSVQTYNNSAGKMMDRNLGATNATKGDVGALGLLYQWGRKDPFLGSDVKYYASNPPQAASTLSWPDAIAADDNSSDATVNLRKSIANPTKFIKNINKKITDKDWYCTNSSYKNDNLWNSSKTIYDPCPAGYRVPDGGESGVWSKAFGKTSEWTTKLNWDGDNMGMDFGKTDFTLVETGSAWYPAAGSRSNSGLLNYVGIGGYYWSCTPTSNSAYDLYFVNSGNINPSRSSSRVSGHSVRCLSESK